MIALVSGGLDSLAAWRLAGLPTAMWVDYGQEAAEWELAAITAFAAHVSAPSFFTLNLPMPVHGNGWVPQRNNLLVLLAAQRDSEVLLGRVAEWAPDKNGRWKRRLERLARSSNTGATQGVHGSLTIHTPYAHLTKRGLLAAYAAAYGADEAAVLDEIAWSCYRAGGPCGECSGCQQRNAVPNTAARWQDGLRWVRDDGWLGVRQMTARWREQRVPHQ